MIRIACFILVFFSLGSMVRADVDAEDGYVYRDGLWYRGANAFTRIKVVMPGTTYFSCGHYYQTAPSYYWNYVAVPTNTVPPYTLDWKNQLLKVAAARDDYQAYLAGLRALGYQGQDAGYGSINLGSFGANASTLYGYSYSSLKDVYGDTNLNTLYQQASRLTQNAQQLAGQANSDFSAIVGQEGSNRARVAEILAKGQAAKAALDAASAAPATRTQTNAITFGTVPNGKSDDTADVTNVRAAWQQAATNRCAACHTGKAAKGGFDIAGYLAMPIEQRAKVLVRLRTTDKDRTMPRNGDGAPTQQIPDNEFNLWAVVK